jgi:hypothetical protein
MCNRQPRDILRNDTTRIAAIEVKKLERTKTGRIARSKGLDYNTTPPCGTIRIYDDNDSPLDVKGFYLFVAQEKIAEKEYTITALSLCEGDILNDDFDFYLSIVGQRQKEIGLGTYGDGANRVRPMLIFANPLGASELDQSATLVTDSLEDKRVGKVYVILRETKEGENKAFYAYRKLADIPDGWQVQTLKDPFPQPKSRNSSTQSRGRFRLPIKVK